MNEYKTFCLKDEDDIVSAQVFYQENLASPDGNNCWLPRISGETLKYAQYRGLLHTAMSGNVIVGVAIAFSSIIKCSETQRVMHTFRKIEKNLQKRRFDISRCLYVCVTVKDIEESDDVLMMLLLDTVLSIRKKTEYEHYISHLIVIEHNMPSLHTLLPKFNFEYTAEVEIENEHPFINLFSYSIA